MDIGTVCTRTAEAYSRTAHSSSAPVGSSDIHTGLEKVHKVVYYVDMKQLPKAVQSFAREGGAMEMLMIGLLAVLMTSVILHGIFRDRSRDNQYSVYEAEAYLDSAY